MCSYEKINEWRNWRLYDKLLYNNILYELKRIFIDADGEYEFEWYAPQTDSYKYVGVKSMNKSIKFKESTNE